MEGCLPQTLAMRRHGMQACTAPAYAYMSLHSMFGGVWSGTGDRALTHASLSMAFLILLRQADRTGCEKSHPHTTLHYLPAFLPLLLGKQLRHFLQMKKLLLYMPCPFLQACDFGTLPHLPHLHTHTPALSLHLKFNSIPGRRKPQALPTSPFGGGFTMPLLPSPFPCFLAEGKNPTHSPKSILLFSPFWRMGIYNSLLLFSLRREKKEHRL